MAGAAMLFIGRNAATRVVFGSLRASSSAAIDPATALLRSRNDACAVSQGRKPPRETSATGSKEVNTCTPLPVLAAWIDRYNAGRTALAQVARWSSERLVSPVRRRLEVIPLIAS